MIVQARAIPLQGATLRSGDNAPSKPVASLWTELCTTAQMSRAHVEEGLPEGLTLPLFAVLDHVCECGDGQTPMRIARALSMPKASLTNMLAGLVERRCLTMTPDPKDGRAKRIFVTAQGHETREKARQTLTRSTADLVAALGAITGRAPEEAMNDLRAGLSALRAVLQYQRDPESVDIRAMMSSSASARSNDSLTGSTST